MKSWLHAQSYYFLLLMSAAVAFPSANAEDKVELKQGESTLDINSKK